MLVSKGSIDMNYAHRQPIHKTCSRLTAVFVGTLFCLTFMTSTRYANAETLHALLVIMDTNPLLGTAMQANEANITHLLRIIERESGMQIRKKHLRESRDEARIANIRDWINTIRLHEDDVLFLYFSGTGKALGTQPTEEYLALQDGLLYQSELRRDMQHPPCRLKLLVTDRCDNIVEIPEDLPPHAPVDTVKIDALFRKHQGFLHLTSATGSEFGWADAREGGLLTHALLHTIDADVHANTWKDLLKDIQETTDELFQAAYPNLSAYAKALIKEKGIKHQIPKAYSLPTHIESDTPRETETLWAFTNRDAPFSLQVGPNQKNYQRYDYIIFGIELKQDAYVVILNWAADGQFKCLLPNTEQEDNWMRAGQHLIPNRDSTFDIKLKRTGTEKFKILALRAREDSSAIAHLFPPKDEGVLGQRRTALERDILQILQNISTQDWDESSFAAQVLETER